MKSLSKKSVILRIGALTVAYYLLGAVGLRLAEASQTFASPVWPAAGLAIAVAWLCPAYYLIGVLIGAFFLSALAMAPVHPLIPGMASAAVSAVASVVQALLTVWLLRDRFYICFTLGSVRDYLLFAFFTALCCVTASTFSCLGHAIIFGHPFSETHWVTWWVGDALGVLVVTPLILQFRNFRYRTYSWRQDKDFIKFAGLATFVCLLLFWSLSPLSHSRLPLGYALIPLVAWASLRFEQRGVSLAVSLISISAIWATAKGVGPFAEKESSILELQGFIAFLCYIGGVIAAAMTEKRMAQEALRSSVTQLVPDIIACTSREGVFTYLNPAFETITGFKPEEWLGRRWADLVHHEDLAVLAKNATEMVQGSVETKFAELRARTRSGHFVHVECKARAFFKNGAVDHVVSVTRDVTLRKAAETALNVASRALERSQQDLEKKVALRTAELTRVNEQLFQSTNEAKEFAFIASHDLQEPLRTISLHLQLIEPQLVGKLDAGSLNSLHFVVEAAKRARTLINGLLTYTHLERNSAAGFGPTDLNRVVAVVLDDLAATIKKNEAAIEVGTLPTIEGDNVQLAQLFQNLISNALKFSGGPPPRIKVSAAEIDKGVVLSVEDNGVGIEEQYFDKVFRLFSRIDRNNTVTGTGIGLAICKKIVERHHGKIWVESCVDRGTKFSFFLPRFQPVPLTAASVSDFIQKD